MQRELDEAADELAPLSLEGDEVEGAGGVEGTSSSAASDDVTELDGTLSAYRAYALAHHPGLRAKFERWRAESYGPDATQQVPSLVVTYGGFIRAVETRVGPQRHKLGLMQWLPWPTTLTRPRDAAQARAESARRGFEAGALAVAAEVDRAYWDLWILREQRRVLADQQVVLDGLSGQIEAGISVGRSDVGDAARVALAATRLGDSVASLDAREDELRARLLMALGAPEVQTSRGDTAELPTRDAPPPPISLGDDVQALIDRALTHPDVDRLLALAESERFQAEAARARQAPSLGLGVDWVIVGEGDVMAPDAGKDAVIAMASVKIPLSFGASAAEASRARARGAAYRADAMASRQRLAGEVRATVARLDDAGRRVALHRETLRPQAESTFEAVLAGYVAGRGGVSDLLMAEQEALEVGLRELQARRDFAVAWSDLQALVGGPVTANEEPMAQRDEEATP